jgi:hypothetical protein
VAGEVNLPCVAFQCRHSSRQPPPPHPPAPRPPRKMVFCNDMAACYGHANRNTRISRTRGN